MDCQAKTLPELPEHTTDEYDRLVTLVRRWGALSSVVKANINGEEYVVQGRAVERAAKDAGLAANDVHKIIIEGITLDEAGWLRLVMETSGRDRARLGHWIDEVLRAFPGWTNRQYDEAFPGLGDQATWGRRKKKLRDSGAIAPRRPATIPCRGGAQEREVLVALDAIKDRGDEEDRLKPGLNAVRKVRARAAQVDLKERSRGPFAKKDPEVQIHHTDFRDLEQLVGDLSGVVDLHFGDPPWGDEDLRRPYAEFVARTLRPGGVLACYTGSFHTFAWHEALRKADLTLVWKLVAINNVEVRADGSAAFGGATRYNGRFRSCYRDILIFVKGETSEYCISHILDDVYCARQRKERNHTRGWSQPLGEALYLIEKLSEPGSLLLDATCGSGTSAVATAMLGQGRRYHGCDISRTEVGNALREVDRVIEERRQRGTG